jgi:hypothetical protein
MQGHANGKNYKPIGLDRLLVGLRPSTRRLNEATIQLLMYCNILNNHSG